MKRNSIKVLENSIFWQEHVLKNSRDPKQKARCQEAILSLMQEIRDIKREEQERALDRGIAEQAAWYDTSAELA